MATPLTFGNPLKFGPDSYHNAKGRPTFLHRERERERERESTRSSAQTTRIYHREGPLTSPACEEAVATVSVRTKARRWQYFPLSQSRLSVDRDHHF